MRCFFLYPSSFKQVCHTREERYLGLRCLMCILQLILKNKAIRLRYINLKLTQSSLCKMLKYAKCTSIRYVMCKTEHCVKLCKVKKCWDLEPPTVRSPLIFLNSKSNWLIYPWKCQIFLIVFQGWAFFIAIYCESNILHRLETSENIVLPEDTTIFLQYFFNAWY